MTDLALTRAAVIEATTRHKAGPMAENILRNLHYVEKHPHLGAAFSGTAVVCGAGPSLNEAMPSLQKCYGYNPVVAVNTAGPALFAASVVCDVLVCIESLDMSQHIGASGNPKLIVLDLSAHPNSWATAVESGARVAWICDQGMGTGLAYELGVRPLMGGGFSLSSAVEMVRICGADGVVLCGADLGYPGGAAYAKGAGWDGLNVAREGERLRFTGREDRDAVHEASRVPAIPRDRPLFDVPAWGGGTIATVYDFIDQRDWLAAWAALSRDGRLRLQNASVGGARIDGWLESAIDGATGTGTFWHAAGRLPSSAPAQRWLLAQCDAARRMGAFFAGETDWPDSEAMVTPIPFVLAVAVHDLYMLRDAHAAGAITEGHGIQAQYGTIRRAADRVEELLKGEA